MAKKREIIITCNAKQAQDTFDFLNKSLADIKAKMQLNEKGAKSGWTEQMKKDFAELDKMASSINNFDLLPAEKSLRKLEQGMKNLAGSTLKDVKRALNEAKSDLNKLSEKDPNRTKLNEDISKLARQIEVIGGKRRSLADVTNDLKNLSNVRFDHLQQDLEAVRAKYAQLTTAQRQGSVGASLKNSERLLTAQMAVAQTPVSVTPVATLTAQQLRSEQSALNSAMAATNGVKGFETFGTQPAARLKAVNEQLTILSEKEKHATADAKELTQTQKAADVVNAVYRNLTVSLEELDATYKTLEARANKFAGVNPAKAKVAQQQMAAVAAKIKEIKASMQEEIRIDKQFLRNATNQQLQAALSQLQQKLQGLNSTQKKEADAIVADMKRVKNQIDQNTAAVNNQKSAWGALGTTLKDLTAYVGVFAMFNKLKGLFEDFISKNREFSDQLANVRKVSGLAMNDIKELANNLSKIDSRTSLEGLMELSYTGAKLGFGNYGIEGLESFAKSAVKVQNALSEDMGADAMTALSKMVEVMGLIPKMGVERAMDATGSAIFKLASTSTATGTNIVEFSKRLMGLANIAHISTQDLLAFGSAADLMALAPEVAATAFNKFITAMQKQPNLIEDALHIEKGTISDLYQAGKMTDAMVLVFEKMREKGGMNALMQAGVFKDLGSDGARLVSVMATMANRVDMLNAHLAVSRQAFEEGTAVAQEYAIQMDTAQAYTERAANIWEKAFVNPEGVDVVKEFSKAWYEVSKSLTQNEKFMLSVKLTLQGILLLLKGIMSILPELMAMLLSGGIGMLITNLRTGEGLLASLTSWFGKLTAAQKMFFKAAGWVGLALTIFEVGKAIYDFAQKTKEAAIYMKDFKTDLSDLNREYGKGELELRRYRKAIDEANTGTKQRMAAITNFNSKFGAYLKNLLTEKSTVDDVYAAYQRVLQVMRAKIALQLKEKDINAQVLPREQWTADRRQEYEEAAKRAGKGQYGSGWITGYAQDNASKSVDDIVSELGKKFYNIPDAVMKEVMVQAKAGNKEFNNWGNIINSRYLNDANAILAASAYLRQDRSAQNAMNRVNKKWKPEQDAMDAYLAGQQQEEQYEPLVDSPDKNADKAARKAAQAAKKDLKDRYEQAKKDVEGVIAKIDELYNRQEAAAKDAQSLGQLTDKEADDLVKMMEIARNEALMRARKAIGTGDEQDIAEWKRWATEQMPKLVADSSKWSTELYQAIVDADITRLREFLATLNGDNIADIDARPFLDKILKKGAESKKKSAVLQAQFKERTDQFLRQYEVIIEAQKKMRDDLQAIGIMTETPAQMAQRIAEGRDKQPKKLKSGKTITDEEAYAQMGAKFVGQGTIPYRINIENADEALAWIQDFATNAQGELEDFAQAFPMVEQMITLQQRQKELQEELIVLKLQGKDLTKEEKDELNGITENLKEAIPTIQAMFYQLETSANNVADTIKKQVEAMTGRKPIGIDEMGLQHEQQMNLTRSLFQAKIDEANAMGGPVDENGDNAAAIELKKQRDQQLIDLEYQYQQQLYQIREQMGWVTQSEQYDNEVAMYKNMLDRKLISEKEFQQKRAQLQMKQGLNYAQMYNQQMSQIIDTLRDYEIQVTENKYDRMIQAAQANGESTAALEEEKEAKILDIKKKYAGAELMVKIGEIGVNTALGIMNAFATLPYPAAVVAAALIGALGAAQTALAVAQYQKVMGTSVGGSGSAGKKIKLASGMLTYDEGNVQTVVGNDGRVYRAREQKELPEGVSLIKEPIATTVNGQQALVAERGPEIVIGRRTTRAIQMNRPDLLRDLALIDRGITTRKVRTFDEGNISDLATAIRPADANASAEPSSGSDATAERQALIDRLDRSDALMEQVLYFLQNPVAPEIPMYGTGGLHEKIKKADRFMKHYE